MIKFGIVAVIVLCVIALFSEWEYIDQNELSFKYYLDNKPITEQDNPILPFGVAAVWGWDAKIFTVNSEVNSIHFDAEIIDDQFDESLSWDSKEGVTMKADVTLEGRVNDVYLFYANFGIPGASYSGAKAKDLRVYEALRQSKDYLDARMGEITTNVGADDIRKQPQYYADVLLTEVNSYMQKYGFIVTAVIFDRGFDFPDAKVIQDARNMLTNMNSDIESAAEDLKLARGDADKAIKNAGIESLAILGTAEREAHRIRTETDATAKRLGALIELVGVDGVMRLEVANLLRELTTSGHVSTVILDTESVVGQAFAGSSN